VAARRLAEPLIGNNPSAEAEARFYAQIEEFAMVAWLKPNSLRQTWGGSETFPVHLMTQGRKDSGKCFGT
jgi:hypothetical protein